MTAGEQRLINQQGVYRTIQDLEKYHTEEGGYTIGKLPKHARQSHDGSIINSSRGRSLPPLRDGLGFGRNDAG